MIKKNAKSAKVAALQGGGAMDIPPQLPPEELVPTINDRLRRLHLASSDTRAIAQAAPSGTAISVNGAVAVATQPKLNLKPGNHISISAANNPDQKSIDVSIAADDPVIEIDHAGTLAGTRGKLNFIDGSNVTLTVADNAGAGRVDVTIASSDGGGGSGPPYPTLTAPPSAASFTNVQGTATGATDVLNQLVLTCPGSSVTWYPFTLAAPGGGGAWTFIAGFRLTGDYAGGFLGGVCISDGTKYVYFFSGQDIGIQYNTAVQSFGSTLLSRSGDGQRGGVLFLKIRDDGTTNRTYHVSTDGQNWIQVYSEGRTANFTATKAGYVVLGPSSSIAGQEMVFHHSLA